jgi:hypothetical protein
VRSSASPVSAERSSSPLYALQLGLGVAGLAGCTIVLALGVRAVHVAPAAAHRVDVGGLRFTYPTMDAAAVLILALAALGAAVLLVATRSACRQLSAHRRLMRSLPLQGTLPGHPTVTLIDAATPMAFCAGWLQPRIYVSTAALEHLSDRELQAVLAHEQHHRALRDPLRLAISRALSQALFFLPILQPLHARYDDLAEQTADAAAVRALGGAAAPLATAMLAFGTTPTGDVVGISPGRVDSLTGRPPAWRLPWVLLAGGLVTLAGVVALAWRASGAASAQASLNLPIASSQPCLLVLALVPVIACLAGVLGRRSAARRLG